ncbi:unnamed protein product [Meganyctiphanes norvegica]|uniref:Uncharacterized protein n=1 Tax=Meganyctiphanes norvegica TaxID=48144 RepID=A0AAV2S5K2_MEGNR
MEGKWINDNVVAFAFNEMQKMHDSKLKNIVFVRPAMTHMIKVSNDENDIKMIIEDLGLRKADYAFFPVNNNLSEKEGGSHWSLMIFSRKENTFYHLDPIIGMNDGSVALLIKKLIDINTKFPEVKYVMCPRQRNGYDCGPYTLMFAEKIAENIEAGTELTKIGECNAREYRMKLRKVIEERSKDKCEKSNRNKKQEMGEKSIENKVQTSHVKDFKEQKKVEKKRECWHFTNRTCKFGDQCRDEHKKHCQEMVENGYCFDNECRLGHPIICREIYETGSCKRFICKHFHPINLRNQNQKKQSNWRHETERPSNRRPRIFYQKKEIDNTKPHNEDNQWGYKRDHRNTFFREPKSKHDRSYRATNGKSNGSIGREDMEQVPMKNLSKQGPWKITYQNIRRLVSKNKKDKVTFFADYTKQEKILIMNFTETWLDETIQDDPKIEGYKLHRGDRKGRVGGGTAIYVREEFEAQKIAELSSNGVEMVAVYIEKLNIINIVIYRPPDARTYDFQEILIKVRVILKDVKAPEPTVILSGDFNFPFAKWKRNVNGGCILEEKTSVGATREQSSI